MKSLKLKRTLFILIIAIALMPFGTAMAKKAIMQPTKKVVGHGVTIDADAVHKASLICDLEVRFINSTQCYCNEVSNVGAMLYKDIWVSVANYSCNGKGTDNVKAFLDVQYFDLMANRLVNKTFPLTLAKDRSQNVKVKSGFVLIQQNPGIKATLRLGNNGLPIADCNRANNRKVARQCQLAVVQ